MSNKTKQAKPTSPLHEVAKALKKLKPDEFKRLVDEARERAEKQAGKQAKPPVFPTGKCIVCGGIIQVKVVSKANPDWERRLIDKLSPRHWASRGYYCTGCGIKYETLPPGQTA